MSEHAPVPSVNAARGLVAVGDSIRRGSGEAMLGLRMQSWALWLAEALRMPYTCLARDGACVGEALQSQAPLLEGRYDIGCIYIGVKDVRGGSWDPDRYERQLQRLADAVSVHCEALLIVLLPTRIGVPPAPQTVQTTELRAALAPLGDVARLRYALIGRLPAQLRDWRRRLIEGRRR